MRTPQERLWDILEAVSRIQRYLPTTLEALQSNEERQVWFVHHLQIVGEAARSLDDGVRMQMPAVPWRQWVGLRHILVHEYFGIDVPAVFRAVTEDLSAIQQAVQTWLESHPGG
jgi:uncharacterized protein with HEPN domain